jgi:thiol-disulfide isomerase/thioredoxin
MAKAGWFLIGVVGVAALAAGAYVATRSPQTRDASTLLALSLPDADGREHRLSEWKGKVLVVNFWATWCDPCREEMPEFVRAQSEFGDRGLQFVGIAVDQPENVSRFQHSPSAVNYPALIGGYGSIELSRTLGNRLAALPFTIIIDRHGDVVHTQLGVLKPQQLRSILGKLL